MSKDNSCHKWTINKCIIMFPVNFCSIKSHLHECWNCTTLLIQNYVNGCWISEPANHTCANIFTNRSWLAGLICKYSFHHCLAYTRNNLSFSDCRLRSIFNCAVRTSWPIIFVGLGKISSWISITPAGTLLSLPTN